MTNPNLICSQLFQHLSLLPFKPYMIGWILLAYFSLPSLLVYAQEEEPLYYLIPRGTIYDRNDKVLAESRMQFNASVIPNLVDTSQLEEMAQSIAPIIQVSASKILKAIRISNPELKDYPLRLKTNISKKEYLLLRKLEEKYTAVYAEEEYRRAYPNGSLAAHLLGYIEPSSNDYASSTDASGYDPADLFGVTGLEKSFEDDLGMGYHIYTTIDLNLQKALEKSCSVDAGACIILDAKNGDVLAMTSRPTFNPNHFCPPRNRKAVAETMKLKGVLYNRAIQVTYHPGSSFKVITAISALDNEIIDATKVFNCPGFYKINDHSRTFRCHYEPGHGKLDLVSAIQHSCNVYFYNLAYEIGVENITNTAIQFGLGESTLIELPYEKTGVVPTKTWRASHNNGAWYDGETILVGIGQGALAATPLQMAMMYHTIANKGVRYKPRLVRLIEMDQRKEEIPVTKIETLPIEPTIFKTIIDGMKRVTQKRGGTAYSKFGGYGHNIAGKTGSAELGDGTINTWFISFAPADDPEILVLVFVENGISGEMTSAPIARSIYNAYF